jgi:hypothetical protein
LVKCCKYINNLIYSNIILLNIKDLIIFKGIISLNLKTKYKFIKLLYIYAYFKSLSIP